MSLILDEFTTPDTCLTLESISRRTGLPRSTAHRILDQLVRVDWLTHMPDGYVLGARSLRLGGGGRNEAPLREAAAARLQELHMRTGLVTHMGILDSDEIYCLDKIGFRSSLDVPSRVGGRLDVRVSAMGRAILAWLEPEHVERILGAGPCRKQGANGTFHDELARIRAAGGLAYYRSVARGFATCAAAIRSPYGPVAAVSVVGECDLPVQRVAPLVANVVRRVSKELWPEYQFEARSRRLSLVRN